MTYQQAIEYLNGLQFFGIKMGLDNITRLLQELGNLHTKYPAVHVAGTNGKGTTCALIESVLRQSGYKTGLYTSPHLVDFVERIRVSGCCINKEYVVSFVQRIQPLVTQIKATFFEVTTAMALTYFADQGIDIAVLETGLGGRLDATNVVMPVLSIITPIFLDHTQHLGATIKEIAVEKGGIIKNNIPVLLANMNIQALTVLQETASQRGCSVYVAGRLVRIDEVSQSSQGYRFTATTGCNKLRLELPLAGKHQLKNATTALCALVRLRLLGWQDISDRAICKGFANLWWPARFEILMTDPIVVLDASHNVAGAQTVAETFKSYFPNRKPFFVVGIMADKDLKGIFQELGKWGGRMMVTQPQTHRAADIPSLTKAAKDFDPQPIPSVAQAVKTAIDHALPNEVVVVTGSFFTAGEAMQHLGLAAYGR